MIADLATSNYPYYDFSEPIDPSSMLVDDQLFTELVSTSAFQRLKSIRFLGGIDYCLIRSPNGIRGNIRYTRYQHSLGVARLAVSYGEMRALSFSDRRLVYVAALLHDIGHAPLSHSLEPVFAEVFGLEHHRATEDVVSGREPIGRDLYAILRRHNVDVERVIAIIAGEELNYDGFFAGPINFDTIEGILRSLAFVRPNLSIPSPEIVTKAALRRETTKDRDVVDSFWNYKNWIYQNVINSRAGVLADYACQYFMRLHLNGIERADYFSTEDQMFRKLPGLIQLLTSPSFEADIIERLQVPITFKSRRFFVDTCTDFFAREDKHRYKQDKHERTLQLRDRIETAESLSKRDLFSR
jgi:hypothetical protein